MSGLEQRIIVCELPPVEAGAAAPTRILVSPAGRVPSRSGEFTLDAASAAEIIAAFQAHGVDLPIDREHASLGGAYASPDGSAPAMGWIKRLEFDRAAGLYAHVEWTPAGAAHVTRREYRYVSPVMLVERATGRAVGLHSVALTNKPAIPDMPPLVNKEATDGRSPGREPDNRVETHMNSIREALALPDGADEQAIVTAIKGLQQQAALGVAACKELGIQPTATPDSLVVAMGAARQPDPAAYMPVAEVSRALDARDARLATLEAAERDRAWVAFSERAMSAGKLSAAMLPAWKERFEKDPEGTEALLAVQPVIAPVVGRIAASDPTPGPGDRVMVINRAMADFKASRTSRALTSAGAFVREALRAAGLSDAMSDDERKLLVA